MQKKRKNAGPMSPRHAMRGGGRHVPPVPPLLGHCMGHPEHVDCLISLNFDSKRMQYLFDSKITHGIGKGVIFHPFHPAGCATGDSEPEMVGVGNNDFK